MGILMKRLIIKRELLSLSLNAVNSKLQLKKQFNYWSWKKTSSKAEKQIWRRLNEPKHSITNVITVIDE
jgi:hypothetical protein